MKKTLSARQLGLIAFISILALKLTIVPALMFEKSGIDAIFSVFLINLVDFLEFILIYHVLKKNQNIGFYDYLCKHFGKFLAKVILFLIFIFYFLKLIALTSGGYNYSKQAIFKNAPLYLFLFILLSISNSLYLFRLKSYGRTVEFTYPFIVFMFLGFLLIAVLSAPLQDLRPFFQHSFGNILESAFSFGLIGGNFIFMLLFMGKIKFGKNSTRSVYGHVLLGIFSLISFYFIDYSIFKYTAFAHLLSISEIVQFLPLPALLGSFDWFAVSLMLILFCFQGGLYMFCTNYALCGVAKFKKTDKKWLSHIVLIFINILILIFVYLIFPSFFSMRTVLFNQIYIPIFCQVVYLIPIFVYLCQLVVDFKNRKKIRSGIKFKFDSNIKLKQRKVVYEKDF